LNINTQKSPWWQRPFKYAALRVVEFALRTKLSQKCYDEAGRIREKVKKHTAEQSKLKKGLEWYKKTYLQN